MASLELWSGHAGFEGRQRFDRHESIEIGLLMRFQIFLPNQAARGQVLTLRCHAGHDPGYYLISTFIADPLAHHAQALCAGSPTLAQPAD